MTDVERLAVLRGGEDAEEREARLDAGAEALAERGDQSLLGRDRLLLAVSAALMVLGLAAILLGWLGAARTTVIEEQVPYLISGGLLGVAVATIGAVTLFAHWLTVLIREDREREVARQRDHEELLAELRTFLQQATEGGGSDGRARGTGRQRAVRRAPGSS